MIYCEIIWSATGVTDVPVYIFGHTLLLRVWDYKFRLPVRNILQKLSLGTLVPKTSASVFIRADLVDVQGFLFDVFRDRSTHRSCWEHRALFACHWCISGASSSQRLFRTKVCFITLLKKKPPVKSLLFFLTFFFYLFMPSFLPLLFDLFVFKTPFFFLKNDDLLPK